MNLADLEIIWNLLLYVTSWKLEQNPSIPSYSKEQQRWNLPRKR